MNMMAQPVRAMAAPVGLYAHVRSNHMRSLALFAGFLVAFHLMAVALLLGLLLLLDWEHAPFVGGGGYTTRYMLPITLVGMVLFAARYWWHVNSVRKDTGFHYVDATDEPRLCRLIEPLLLASGIKPPFVGVIESEALNAFAVGVSDRHTVVVVTRGLIDGLDDEELEAVLAHELMHIRFRDTRLMAAANAFIGNLQWLHAKGMNGGNLEDGRAAMGLILLPILLPLVLVVNFLGQLAFRVGYFSRAAIGSSREFIADAESVRLTQNPAALVAALKKVDGRDRIAGMAASHDAMLIAGAVEGPAATHPTVAQRIAALVQTTGPAVSYAPLRRDTRSPEQRRRSGFGRSLGADLIDEVRESQRPSLWQIFRQTRDPDRNIFGLNFKSSLVVLASCGAFVVLWWGTIASSNRRIDPRDLLVVGEITRLAIKCPVMGIGGLAGVSKTPAECKEDAIDSRARELNGKLGIPFVDFGAKRRAEFEQRWQTQRLNRCFPYTMHSWSRKPYPGTGPTDIDVYHRLAQAPIPGIDAPVEAGTTRADGLIRYMEKRLLAADNVPYFFGELGRQQLIIWFDTPRHNRAVRIFREGLERPAFAEHFEKTASHDDSIRLLAEMPLDAVACAKKRAEGSFVKLDAAKP